MIVETVEVHELAQEGYDGYEKMVIAAIEHGKKEFPTGDFFIDVIWRKRSKERGGLIKQAIALENIPTPHFNQTVYIYHRSAEEVEMLWSVPAQEVCLAYYNHRHAVPPSDYPLLEQVIRYFDGTLFKIVDTYDKKNKEIIHGRI